MWAGNNIIGAKVTVNVVANNELEGMCKANSVSKKELEGASSSCSLLVLAIIRVRGVSVRDLYIF